MQNELYHYGVKGMRWGVRRTKHQLSLEKKARLQMKEALASGRFKKAVNRESQMRHLIGKGYIPGRSYMFGDLETVQKLVDKYSGSGRAIPNSKTGDWLQREVVDVGRIIGVHINYLTKEENFTTRMTIIYSRTGTHVYPAESSRSRKR